MPHFMIVSIPYINLLNCSWIIKCLFFRNIKTKNKFYNVIVTVLNGTLKSTVIFFYFSLKTYVVGTH